MRDHAGPAAMGRYERQYGILAEGPLDGWQDHHPRAAEIPRRSSSGCGLKARQSLGGSA
ncbi:hypothetical protein [Streptomyces alboflavus]|uniref:hypothetical protein n=1 Tax=Streptomyces alboflavus TaxID=67267 RepID=UPI001F1664F6|nr:hypothetical protein [Streptomyces alboflavus]